MLSVCVSPQCALYVLEKENYKNTEYIMYYYIEPPCVCVGRLKSKKTIFYISNSCLFLRAPIQ